MAVDSSYNFIALTGKKGEKGDSGTAANYLGILNSLPESASVGDYFVAGDEIKKKNKYNYVSVQTVYNFYVAYYRGHSDTDTWIVSLEKGKVWDGNYQKDFLKMTDWDITNCSVLLGADDSGTEVFTCDFVGLDEDSEPYFKIITTTDSTNYPVGHYVYFVVPYGYTSITDNADDTYSSTDTGIQTGDYSEITETSEWYWDSWQEFDQENMSQIGFLFTKTSYTPHTIYTPSFVYTYTSSGTWEQTDDIKNIDVFSDIVSLANSSNNATAVQIVKRLVASDIFVENLAAQKILFQNYVASISSSTTPESGDMMIYMGKNPKNFTADSEYQFAISKFIGQIGGQEMWKDMLKTKLLASGLLSLMITGCANVTDDITIQQNSIIEDSGFAEFQSTNTSTTGNKNLKIITSFSFNDKHYCITYDNLIYETETFTDWEINTSLKNYIDNQNLSCVPYNLKATSECLFLTTTINNYICGPILKTTDMETWEILYTPTCSSVHTGFFTWKNKKLLVYYSKENGGIFNLYDYSGNLIKTISANFETSFLQRQFLVTDDYITILNDKNAYLFDGDKVINAGNSYLVDNCKDMLGIGTYDNKIYYWAQNGETVDNTYPIVFYQTTPENILNGNKSTALNESFYVDVYTILASMEIFEDGIFITPSTLFYSGTGANLKYFDFATKELKTLISFVNDTKLKFSYENGNYYVTDCTKNIIYYSSDKKNWSTLELELDSNYNIQGVIYISDLNKFIYALISTTTPYTADMKLSGGISISKSITVSDDDFDDIFS